MAIKKKYRPEYAAQARRMVEQGKTNKQIAAILGVSRPCLNYWMRSHEEFKDAMRRDHLPDHLKKKNRHQKGLYKKSYDAQAYELCLLGFKNEDLREFFNISQSTLDKWIATIDSFNKCVKQGKARADGQVAKALLKRSLGYESEETVVRVVKGKIEKVKIKKHHPPDVSAITLWLKNRQPKFWQDKKELTIEGKDVVPFSELESGVDE